MNSMLIENLPDNTVRVELQLGHSDCRLPQFSIVIDRDYDGQVNARRRNKLLAKAFNDMLDVEFPI